jgi:mannose-6-phosphate isomerase-like protein (cupin superfamily)
MKKLHIRESDLEEVQDMCGSLIALINPATAPCKNISIATFFINPGNHSRLHYHKVTEEVYYFIYGHGQVEIDNEVFEVGPGDAVYIPPMRQHKIVNNSSVRLKFLAIDTPSFDESDVHRP